MEHDAVFSTPFSCGCDRAHCPSLFARPFGACPRTGRSRGCPGCFPRPSPC